MPAGLSYPAIAIAKAPEEPRSIPVAQCHGARRGLGARGDGADDDRIGLRRMKASVGSGISAVVGGTGLFLAALGITGAAVAFGSDVASVWGSIGAIGLVALLWSLLHRRSQGPHGRN